MSKASRRRARRFDDSDDIRGEVFSSSRPLGLPPDYSPFARQGPPRPARADVRGPVWPSAPERSLAAPQDRRRLPVNQALPRSSLQTQLPGFTKKRGYCHDRQIRKEVLFARQVAGRRGGSPGRRGGYRRGVLSKFSC